MTFMEIRKTELNDLPNLVTIFQEELPLSIFNRLGQDFISDYFFVSLKHPDCIALTATDGKRSIGFAVFCLNPMIIWLKTILKNPFRNFFSLFFLILKNPRLLFDLCLALLKERQTVKPELLSIAVKKELQNQGVGQALLQNIRNLLKEKGVTQFKVGVWEEMTKANAFYQKMGAQFYYSTRLFGQTMNCYLYKI